jgi:dTDP-4-amino-4,6-dideoxygalactose transaminase
MSGNELNYISDAYAKGKLAGDGPYTKLCHSQIEIMSGASKALLTHSCTAALEMAAILLDIQPGDEVILPSYTFVSTANAFLLRGGIPVFVDIRSDTLNLDERLIEQAITNRTKAIVPVHYAGVACEMDSIMQIAIKHNLFVVEDAAQGVMSEYKGQALGGIGGLGAYSFHETKNVISGEGGALLVNDPALVDRAEIIREKGTDRGRFFRGQVDKYTWQDIGSSFLPGELIAAFLWAQLESAKSITDRRLAAWKYYHEMLVELEQKGVLRRPIIPQECTHNGHMYYILLKNAEARSDLIDKLRENGVHAVFHYIPLHSSPAGGHFGRHVGDMAVTDRVSESILRLPLWVDILPEQQQQVIDVLTGYNWS